MNNADCEFMDLERETLGLPAAVTGNGEACPKQWLAVYVRLYHEKKTSARLDAMGIENFLPIQEEIHQWSDRRKKISRVLIPTIVFVRVAASERKKVLELYSVNRYMANRGESVPLVIPDDQMERFRFMLDYSDSAVSVNSHSLIPGEEVRVIKGPLSGLKGELVTVDGKTKVAVRIAALGFACVEMPVGFIEKLKA